MRLGKRDRMSVKESMGVMRHEVCVCVCVKNELDMGESQLGSQVHFSKVIVILETYSLTHTQNYLGRCEV